MATKKKAPAGDAAPAAASTPARKFPAGARKKKDDPAPGSTPAAGAPEAGAVTVAPVETVAPATVALEATVAPATVVPAGPSDEAIRARAWAIWRMYGGSPMQNWLRAEAELRQEAAKG